MLKMSGKSCGISNNGERQQYMLRSNFMNRNNNNNSTQQLVNAIKQNKSDMIMVDTPSGERNFEILDVEYI